ncbi:class I glutamine amidotransferase-like protein [Coniella lustricola]|uniref:D-lactate dehydratase n=1 Tax=Coniella lustricola TaxID=2025994 RepID=A0A2T3AKG6_9PEZI|nr:class I glutamine amidotransferase-like protein [Coniella lustricola]
MAPKILIVLTSHDQMGTSGKPTGWYLPELAHPYDAFVKAGIEMDFASPKGGHAPLDPASVELFKEDASSTSFLNEHKDLWETTRPLSELASSSPAAADKYDAIFYPGGHGPMYDLANDTTSQKLIAEFAAKGKIVAAVCHGPAAFVNVKGLLEGKEVTGFSNAEEDQVQLSQYMPFMLEDALQKASGGKYVKAAESWSENVVVSGNVITGQNPGSAHKIGEEIVKALKA